MRVERRWLLGGLGLFLGMALVTLPASQILYRLPLPAGVQFAGVEGPWWRGRAGRLRLGDLPLDNLSWHWRPLSLLTGRFSVAGAFRLLGRPGSAVLARSPGAVAVQGLVLDLPAARVGEWLAGGAVTAGGELELRLEHLRLTPQGRPLAASGQLTWREAQLGPPVGAGLGTLTAAIETRDDHLVMDLDDAGGPLALDGGLTYDPATGVYDLQLALRSRNAPDLQSTLSLLGSPDVRGWYHLDRRGRLSLPGIPPP